MKILQLKIWVLIWFLKLKHGFYKISVKTIYAQAKHETGNFTSSIFENNKNLFGMRQAFIRPRTVEGTKSNHAYYKSHSQSIVDYFLRQKYYKVSTASDNEFMSDTIQSNYAEDTKYLQKWESHRNQTKTPLIVNLVVYGGLVFFFLIPTTFYTIKKLKK